MRHLRETTSTSLRETARHMGFSAAYISDLELGRRHWSDELIAQYKTVMGILTTANKLKKGKKS